MILCVCTGGVTGSLQPRLENGTENGGGNGTNSEPVLSADAIANITASSVAVFLIAAMVCYLWQCFDRRQRLDRIRMALERNRQIEKQMAAAKARQRTAQLGEGEGSRVGTGEAASSQEREALIFSAVHRSHELPRLPEIPEEQPLLSSPEASGGQRSTSESVNTSTDSHPSQVGEDTTLVAMVPPGQVPADTVET